MASGILGTLLSIERGKSAFEASASPRIHATPESVLMAETPRLHPETLRALEKDGFRIDDLGDYSFSTGGLSLITRNHSPEEGHVGVADPRRDGSAGSPAED